MRHRRGEQRVRHGNKAPTSTVAPPTREIRLGVEHPGVGGLQGIRPGRIPV